MKNIEIKVSKTSRMVYLKNGNIGNDGENLQGKLVFSFQDKFVDGQARLEYEIDGEKYFAILTKVGESYELPIKNVITKEGEVNMQLVITEGTDENEIPVFKSNVFYVVVNESINAESEEPDGYAQWLDIANTKLNSIDEAVLGVQEAVDYAKEQGDYAKKQADNVISASEEASEIIRHFESDVEEYTSAFNENAENKVREYNTNATSKVKEYDDNATEKLNAYNTNAETKLKEYNENANSKVGEYNVNADNRINDFNQNADSYLDALIPKNEASGVPIYVDDALGYRVLNLSAKGNYKQETTTGKNLLNLNTTPIYVSGASSTFNEPNITITKTSPSLNASCVFIVGDANILNGKTLKYTGELLSGTSRAIIGYADADGGNRVTIAGNTNINSGTFERTITVDGTTYANKKVVVWLYSDVLTTGNIGDKIIYKNVMVSENGGEYEPFTNGASPNPDYPQEIEVIEGYNLFTGWEIGKSLNSTTGAIVDNYTSAISRDYIKVDFEKNPNYYLSGLSDKLYSHVDAYDKDFKYLGRTSANPVAFHSINKKSFTANHVDGDIAYLLVTTYVHSALGGTIDIVNDFKTILNVGTSQKNYLPYNNVGYISFGKNLLAISEIETQTINGVTFTNLGDGTIKINGTSENEIRINVFYERMLSANTEYKFVNFNTFNRPNANMIIKDDEGNTLINMSLDKKSQTYTPSSDTQLSSIRLYIDSKQTFTDYILKIMFIKSSDSETFKPFQETITPIDLKGNFVGKLPNGVADNLLYKDRHIYLEKNVGKVVLDGSEDWKEEGSINSLYRYNIRNLFFPTSRENAGISNYFKYEINYNGTEPHFYLNTNGNHYFFSYISTLAEFKQWLSENKPEVYYPLAETQLIDLGEYDLSTLDGTNNISLLANIEPSEMNMTYAQNIKIYTDRTITQQIVGTLGGEY